MWLAVWSCRGYLWLWWLSIVVCGGDHSSGDDDNEDIGDGDGDKTRLYDKTLLYPFFLQFRILIN